MGGPDVPHETLPVPVILVAAIHGAHGVTLRGLHVLLEELLKREIRIEIDEELDFDCL